MWNLALITCGVVLFFTAPCITYNYQIEFDDERIVTKCEEHPNLFLDSVTTLEDVKFEVLDNNSIHITGGFQITANVPDPLKVIAGLYKRQNDQWVDTIYNVVRKDTCVALFSQTEFWSVYTRTIPPKKRKCPFANGYYVDLDFLSDLTLKNIADKRFDGEYKAIIKLYSEDGHLYQCFEILMNLIRI